MAAIVSTLDGHAQSVSALSFDPSGDWLVADSWDGTPRLWQSSPAYESIRFFSGLNSLRFSQNGKWAGAIYPGDGKAQLLEFIPSKVYRTFTRSLLDSQQSFDFGSVSPDGRLLALSSRVVTVRELPSGRELAQLPVHARMVLFHPNGRELLIGGPQPWIEIWPIARESGGPTRLRLGPPRRLSLPSTPFGFTVAPDGQTLALTDKREGHLLDLTTGMVGKVKFPHSSTDTIALSPDGRWVATSGWQSTKVRVWNAQTGERVLNVTCERAGVTFTPDGRQLVVATPQAYDFYDLSSLQFARRIERQGNMHPGWVAYSGDRKMMALAVSPGIYRICEVATGRTIANLEDPNSSVARWFGFTPDGGQLVLASSYDRAIRHWDLRALREELKAMKLDWDWPEFPPETQGVPQPLEVEVVKGHQP